LWNDFFSPVAKSTKKSTDWIENYVQESEVEQELRLAFEEACLDAGITLSSTISPMVSSPLPILT
jgi:hypothetical protein